MTSLPTTPGSVIDVTESVIVPPPPTPLRLMRMDVDSPDNWLDTGSGRWRDDEIISFVVVLDAGTDR